MGQVLLIQIDNTAGLFHQVPIYMGGLNLVILGLNL